jgi:hypothetical protein
VEFVVAVAFFVLNVHLGVGDGIVGLVGLTCRKGNDGEGGDERDGDGAGDFGSGHGRSSFFDVVQWRKRYLQSLLSRCSDDRSDGGR